MGLRQCAGRATMADLPNGQGRAHSTEAHWGIPQPPPGGWRTMGEGAFAERLGVLPGGAPSRPAGAHSPK
eukprot:13433755-Alexandrium_andersonii.AAC.1